MNFVPQGLLNEGFVAAGMPSIVIEQLAQVHSVVEQFIKHVFVKGAPTAQQTSFGVPRFGFDALFTELLNQRSH